MKITSLRNCVFFFCTLFALYTQAQITIGSSKKPLNGALLMLDDGTTGASGENAKKGLGLPRVKLQAYDKLKMGATAPEYTDKTAHIGLVVYNMNTAFDKCDAASIPSGLHVWDGAKWSGIGAEKHATLTPPDLSSPIYNPNTYMVTTIGSAGSVTIPVAKAFAVWEYWASEAGGKKLVPTPFTGTLSVAVKWEEALGGGDNDIVSTASLSTTSLDKTATITVNTTGNPGNAVVSLSDGTGVRWNWHIWVTDTPATTAFNGLTWMDRNLGATSATPGADGTLGLHYQWGRHTPIPGYTKFDATVTAVPVTTMTIAGALAPDGNGGQNALAYAIAQPLAIIVNSSSPSDWYSTVSSQWDTRWAEKISDAECPAIIYNIPSITNPCPAGWKVPVGTDNHATSPWTGLTLANGGTWNNGYDWTTPSAGYYPAAGGRISVIGSLRPVDYGYYWSASTNVINARYLYLIRTSVAPWYSYARHNSLSVRCVRE